MPFETPKFEKPPVSSESEEEEKDKAKDIEEKPKEVGIGKKERIGPIEKTKMEIPDYLKPYLTKEQLAGKHAILMEQVENAREALKESSLLKETIFNEQEKEKRSEKFTEIWEERYKPSGSKEGYFQTHEKESPFAEYSSKGWKIHIVFTKGREKEIAKLLHKNSLYFKVEAGLGTYFNGLKVSGATIYIGSHDNMEEIAKFVQKNLGESLKEGLVAKVGDKMVRMGSGSDIEVLPMITARFDVAKTEVGWLKGNKKYVEYGLPSWTELGGIPILQKYEKEVASIIEKWNKVTPYQRDLYYDKKLKPIYDESKEELVKDFGAEFLLGIGKRFNH